MLIDTVLKEGKRVLIAVQDTPLAEKDPYSVEERIEGIKDVYRDNPNVEIISIPDIEEICYGRDVGWGIRRIRLEKQLEDISATKIRNGKKRVVWLTGNVGAGKTSLAYLLRDRLNAIVLDGDEMRVSISTDKEFSKEDRNEHNLRVARLARILNLQGHNVIVSVIAPFESTRKKITRIADPYWIHIKNTVDDPDKPYEMPKNADLTIEPTKESLLASLDKIIKGVGDLK